MKNRIEQFEKDICKHYGVDPKTEMKGAAFLNSEKAQNKFFNELQNTIKNID